MARRHITIRMDEELLSRVNRECERRGVTRSAMIEDSLEWQLSGAMDLGKTQEPRWCRDATCRLASVRHAEH